MVVTAVMFAVHARSPAVELQPASMSRQHVVCVAIEKRDAMSWLVLTMPSAVFVFVMVFIGPDIVNRIGSLRATRHPGV